MPKPQSSSSSAPVNWEMIPPPSELVDMNLALLNGSVDSAESRRAWNYALWVSSLAGIFLVTATFALIDVSLTLRASSQTIALASNLPLAALGLIAVPLVRNRFLFSEPFVYARDLYLRAGDGSHADIPKDSPSLIGVISLSLALVLIPIASIPSPQAALVIAALLLTAVIVLQAKTVGLPSKLKPYLGYRCSAFAPGVWRSPIDLTLPDEVAIRFRQKRLRKASLLVACAVCVAGQSLAKSTDLGRLISGVPLELQSAATGLIASLVSYPFALLFFRAMLGLSVVPAGDGVLEQKPDALYSKLQHSAHRLDEPFVETDHLLIGRSVEFQTPVLLHKRILDGHMHLLGGPRDQMAELVLLPVIQQLRSHGVSILVLDSQGSRALASHTQDFLPLAKVDPTDLFRQLRSRATVPSDLAQMLTEALVSRDEVVDKPSIDICRELFTRAIGSEFPETFADLKRRVEEVRYKNRTEFQNATDLQGPLEALSASRNSDDQSLPLGSLFQKPSCALVQLPPTSNPLLNAAVVNLLIATILAEARGRTADSQIPLLLILNDYSSVTPANLRRFFAEAHTTSVAGIFVGIGNSAPRGHTERINSNAGTAAYFSSANPDTILDLSLLSGSSQAEEVTVSQAGSPALSTTTVSRRSTLRSRLSSGDLSQVFDNPKRFILHVRSGLGYSQFSGLPIGVEALQ